MIRTDERSRLSMSPHLEHESSVAVKEEDSQEQHRLLTSVRLFHLSPLKRIAEVRQPQ